MTLHVVFDSEGVCFSSFALAAVTCSIVVIRWYNVRYLCFAGKMATTHVSLHSVKFLNADCLLFIIWFLSDFR